MSTVAAETQVMRKSANPFAPSADLKVWLDGELVPSVQAKIGVFDHGLLYGDGVFEGIRFYQGRVFQFEAHIDRLFDSARAILLEIPMDHSAVIEATLETIRANELRDGYIRLLVTRGPGGRSGAGRGARS